MKKSRQRFLAILCTLVFALGSIGLASFAEGSDPVPAAQESVNNEAEEAAKKAAEEAARKAAEEEAARKAAEEEAARKAAEEEAARKAAEEEAARKAAEEEAARKAAEEEAARKAAEEEAARKAAEEEAARKAAEEEAARKAAEEEAAKKAAEEEAARKAAEEEAAKKAAEEAAKKAAEEEAAKKAAEEAAKKAAEEAAKKAAEEEQKFRAHLVLLKAGKSIYDAATCYNRQAHQLTEDAVVYAEEELSSEKGVVWKIAYAKNGEKKTGFILAGDAKDADADAYKNASDHASLEYKGYYLPDVSMKASPDEEKAAQPAVEEVVEPVVTEEAAVVEPAVAAEPAVEEAKAEEPKMAPAAEATSEEKAPAPVEPTKNEPAQKSMQSAKTRAVSTTAPVILQQPANLADVVPGASAQFKVTGNADSYQWQVNRNDGKGFVNLNESSTWKGTQTDTLTFTAKSAQAAFTFRVVLTTGAGTLESNAVHITFLTAPVISVEPADQTVENAGDTAAFTVVADQAPTYQWQVDRGDGKGFVNLSETVTWRGVTTDTLQFTTKPAQLGFTFRVVVSNAVGSVNSAVVKFTWANPPTILSQTTQEELGEIAVGTTATVKVTGSATTEAYQWEVDRGDVGS